MSRVRLLAFLFVLAVAAYTATAGDGSGGSPERGRSPSARVVRVVDGDTIHVQVGGRRETVRYIGVDTPESVKPGTPVQCFAKRASAFNDRLVAGERVRLVRDAEARDRYGRLLAYVYRARDGRFVNAALVRRGYAVALTIPPNVAHAGRVPPPGRGGAPRRARVCGHPADRHKINGLSMRMRQSLADIEAAFVEEIDADRERRERLQAAGDHAGPASGTVERAHKQRHAALLARPADADRDRRHRDDRDVRDAVLRDGLAYAAKASST